MRHHFQLLGVYRSSTPEELKAAYRRLARLHHPDVSASGLMADINVAYDTLSDAKKRDIYAKCLGPKCEACKTMGCMRKQKGFSKVITTICPACCGAGYLLRSRK